MIRLKLFPFFRLIIVIITLALSLLNSKSGLTRVNNNLENSDKQIVRVYFTDRLTAHKIFVSFEAMILETNYDEKYHIMEVTPAQIALLNDAGLLFDIDTEWIPQMRMVLRGIPDHGIIGYPCYETVKETFANAQAIVDNHPNLAAWIDVGDSWEKTAGMGGNDIMVLVLTNSALPGDKPKFLATSAIHGREYTTAPLCLFFAQYLVDNYNLDADATWILDHHEIHLILHVNPDGRQKAEIGLSWRKNTNQNYCGATSNDRGSDINRNFEYMWGNSTGSSDNECESDYRGPNPVSEPETQAVQAYMRSIFPDQRDTNASAAAPLDTKGIHIDFHSYSEVIIWPWGYTHEIAPNGMQMQTLGRKFAYWNHYIPRQGIGTYFTDGTIKEFCYGDLGVPSFVFELGTEFFQSCSYYEDHVVPDNLPAMIYAAKIARTPYITPSGPNTYDLILSDDFIPSGISITLTATVDDTQFNNRNGTEPTQNIAAAEYYVDTPPWVDNPLQVANSMLPSDGIYDNKVEIVEANVDTSHFSEGKHIIFVRGRDTNDNWGAFSAIFLNVTSSGIEQAATPTFSPTPETYDGSQAVIIRTSSPDAIIYYTTNGDDPNEESAPYEQPLYFNFTTTLKARAYKDGWAPSDIVTENYVITDSDGDGVPDSQDSCPNDINKIEAGFCGCGIADTDSDGNGIPDCSGQDFRVDAEEGQITSIEFLETDDPIYQKEMPDDLQFEPITIDLSVTNAVGAAIFIVHLQSSAPKDYLPYKHTDNGWIDFSRDVISGGKADGAEFIDSERKLLKVYLTDNGKYDSNPAEGRIRDPITVAAPGFVAGQAANDSGNDSGGGGGGGCLISSIF
jgi:hypothetical protein